MVKQDGRLPADLLLLAPTELEAAPLRRCMFGGRTLPVGVRALVQGRICDFRAALMVTGVGKVNAAMAAEAALSRLAAGLVLVFGVGGAYPSAGLEVGDLAVATAEIYGDEGAQGETGFLGLRDMGLSLWDAQGHTFYDRFPVDRQTSARLAACAVSLGDSRSGPFVTVSTVTGTAERAQELRERHAAVCENMEGAAVAQVCTAWRTRFAEVRGISNSVGPRDRSAWRINEAVAAATNAVLAFLEGWGEACQTSG